MTCSLFHKFDDVFMLKTFTTSMMNTDKEFFISPQRRKGSREKFFFSFASEREANEK